MRIFFLTEGGGSAGLGHFTRCQALKLALSGQGHECAMIVHGDPSLFLKLTDQASDHILAWRSAESRLELQKLLARADAVVIDSYLATRADYLQLNSWVPLLISLDDNLRLDYPGAVVINTAIAAEELTYREGLQVLRGAVYCPLRPEFAQASPVNVRPELRTLLITFGGDDPRALTSSVLARLEIAFPELQKTVILGSGFQLGVVDQLAPSPTVQVLERPEAAAMCAALANVDLVISAGGQTLYESARLGRPVVAITVADNQTRNVSGFSRLGIATHAGTWDHPFLLDNIVRQVDEWRPLPRRQAAFTRGLQEVDGRGAIRLALAISSAFELLQTDFRPATWSDRERLLLWRNDPATVSASHQARAVDPTDHESWFKDTLANPTRKLWIFAPQGKPVGTVRFDRETKFAEMSWTIAPEMRGKGFGGQMVKRAAELFKRRGLELRARILSANAASGHIARLAGFRLDHETEGVGHWKMD